MQSAAVSSRLICWKTRVARFVVNEINHTMEFRNSSKPTGVDIAQEVIDFVIGQIGVVA